MALTNIMHVETAALKKPIEVYNDASSIFLRVAFSYKITQDVSAPQRLANSGLMVSMTK